MISVLLLAIFLPSTSSFAFELGARAIDWFSLPDGRVGVNEGGVAGRTIGV